MIPNIWGVSLIFVLKGNFNLKIAKDEKVENNKNY